MRPWRQYDDLAGITGCGAVNCPAGEYMGAVLTMAVSSVQEEELYVRNLLEKEKVHRGTACFQ